jgi:hypothetical protein
MVSDSMRKAQSKYRLNNIDKYNEKQRSYYANKKDVPEWKEQYNAKCRLANARYREKKKLEKGGDLKPRGRPRKIIKLDLNSLVENL